MIGRIAGRIDYRAPDHVLIDVGGLGYLVHCSERTLQALPAAGEHTALYTDLVVREDLMQLVGFTTLVEKEWHRLLTGVQGVGTKASLAILGSLGPDGVARAVALGDWNAVKVAKGIGPKTAQRVVNELKDRAAEVMAMGGPGGGAQAAPGVTGDTDSMPSATSASPPPEAGTNAQAEALSALTNLGYGPGDGAAAVARVAGDNPGADTAVLIRSALKILAPKE
ncbi:Holliday junction branch migration protein RuvA [Marivita sp.]|uniref:Holliday junction branch migration protein RuvA n=1 Tax=Marivita sp. TaxID=2003365 RepID=UPI0025C1F3BD|nr:Holliday junction branch migration protein RuvA [Marivita sp.]